MDTIIDTFHVDLKLLIAQTVNFGIVFLTLYYFAFKPLTKTMQDRSSKIETGLKNADEIKLQLEATKTEQEEIIKQAKQDANELLKTAKDQGEERKTEMIAKAKQEIGQVITAEKDKMQQEKAVILKEIKAEVADLVIATTTKLLGEKVNTEKDKELINKLVK